MKTGSLFRSSHACLGGSPPPHVCSSSLPHWLPFSSCWRSKSIMNSKKFNFCCSVKVLLKWAHFFFSVWVCSHRDQCRVLAWLLACVSSCQGQHKPTETSGPVLACYKEILFVIDTLKEYWGPQVSTKVNTELPVGWKLPKESSFAYTTGWIFTWEARTCGRGEQRAIGRWRHSAPFLGCSAGNVSPWDIAAHVHGGSSLS